MTSPRRRAIGAGAAIAALLVVRAAQASRTAAGSIAIGPPDAVRLAGSDVGPRSPAIFVAAAPGPNSHDYPTATRADYVIGCMAANGNTREALLKCSCAIDTIAGLMPYTDYERAETALSLQQGGGVGGRVGLFRDPPQIKAVIEELRRAQAEANLQCR